MQQNDRQSTIDRIIALCDSILYLEDLPTDSELYALYKRDQAAGIKFS